MELLLIVFGILLFTILIMAIWVGRKQDDDKNAQLNRLTDNIKKFSAKLDPSSLSLMRKDSQQKGVFESQKDLDKNSLLDSSKSDTESPFTWVPVSTYKKDSPTVIVKETVLRKKEFEIKESENNADFNIVENIKLTEVKTNLKDFNLPRISDSMTNNDFTCSILLVDDSMTVLKFTGKLLTKNTYKVLTKMDGWEALTYLQNTSNPLPDLIISDIEMPNMDGIELVKKIRADKKFNHIPVIIISASAENHLNLMEQGLIQGFLHKPYKEKELLDQLEYVLLNN